MFKFLWTNCGQISETSCLFSCRFSSDFFLIPCSQAFQRDEKRFKIGVIQPRNWSSKNYIEFQDIAGQKVAWDCEDLNSILRRRAAAAATTKPCTRPARRQRSPRSPGVPGKSCWGRACVVRPSCFLHLIRVPVGHLERQVPPPALPQVLRPAVPPKGQVPHA